MDWIILLEIGGMLFTAYLVFLLIKESNEGKVSEKCDLD